MANPLLLSSLLAPGHHKVRFRVQNEAARGQKTENRQY